MVELVRRMAANSREYERAIVEAKTLPISFALYTPESFASVDGMKSIINTLRKNFEVDMDYAAKQRQIMSEFREKMAGVDPDYLKKWDSKRYDEEQLQASATELEKQWVSGAVALYEFAIVRYDDVKFYGSPLERTDKTEQQFKEQLASSKALYSMWQQQAREFVKRHNESARNVP